MTTVVVTLVILLSLIGGLGRGEAWAIHAVQPVCIVLIVAGLVRVALALSRNEILIPLETIGALLVLTRPHGPELLPATTADDRQRVMLATIAFAASYFVSCRLSAADGGQPRSTAASSAAWG